MPKPCSSPHCWFSTRTPALYTNTLFPLKPLITGLPIPTPVETDSTPGIELIPLLKLIIPLFFIC